MQASLQTLKKVIKNNKEILPTTITSNKSRCLDFDMETVVFKPIPKDNIKLEGYKQCDKIWLEVINKV